MKKITLLLALVFSFSLIFAQANVTPETGTKEEQKRKTTFKKGDIYVNAGFGVLPMHVIEPQANTITPPLSLSVGLRLKKHFVLSAFAGYSSYDAYLPKMNDGSEWYVKNESLVIGLRNEWHAARWDNVDVYGGFMAGVRKPNVERLLLDNHSGELSKAIPADEVEGPTAFRPGQEDKAKLAFGGFVGGAWYFGQNSCLFGEVGYGVSIATVGLGYKF